MIFLPFNNFDLPSVKTLLYRIEHIVYTNLTTKIGYK